MVCEPEVDIISMADENKQEESCKATSKSLEQQNELKDMSDSTQNTSESFKIPGILLPQKQTIDKNKTNVSGKPTGVAIPEGESGDNKISSDSTDDQKQKRTDSMKTALSPAEQLKQSRAVIPYKEPTWSGVPEDKYSFDVLKNGTIVNTIDLEKSYYVFGRLPSCDVTMEHPSLSRYHAVVQYCKIPKDGHEKGWYVYDLDSTHGTWINKNKTYPNKYYRIRVGHIVKFGGSTRLHILQGPADDAEEESELTATEMKTQREQQKRQAEIIHQAELAEDEKKLEELRRIEEARGCSWGIGEDAAEEENEEETAFVNMITPESEALYINDPKKALKGYFEREGCEEPEYEVVEAGKGKYKCTVELPVDTPSGEPMVAEAVISGKKKDAVVQCALEACRLLDRQGLLRASKHESRKKKAKNWAEDDYYDSDEDIYLDRTGDIEKKRQQRMKKAGKSNSEAETYDSLMTKHQSILNEIQELEAKLDKAKSDATAMNDGEVDALDAYMMAIKSGMMDTKTKMKIKRQLMELKQEEQKLRKLVNIARPAQLPELKRPEMSQIKKTDVKQFPATGKIKSLQSHKGPRTLPVPMVQRAPVSYDSKMEEEEEEDDDEENSEAENTRLEKNNTSKRKHDVNKVNSSEALKKELKVTTTETTELKQSETQSIEVVPSVKSVPEVLESNTPTVESSCPVKAETGPKISDYKIETEVKCPSKRSRETDSIQRSIKKKRTPDKDPLGQDYDDTDPDYAVWMPPKNQSGDGRTHLNEKFGY